METARARPAGRSGRMSWQSACLAVALGLNRRFHGGGSVRSSLAVECAFEGWLRRRWWTGGGVEAD